MSKCFMDIFNLTFDVLQLAVNYFLSLRKLNRLFSDTLRVALNSSEVLNYGRHYVPINDF